MGYTPLGRVLQGSVGLDWPEVSASLKTAVGQCPSAVNRIQGFCCPSAVNSQKLWSKNSGWALGSEFERAYPALNCFVFIRIDHLFRFCYVYKELYNFVGIKKRLPRKYMGWEFKRVRLL